jgi:hypothetical protein
MHNVGSGRQNQTMMYGHDGDLGVFRADRAAEPGAMRDQCRIVAGGALIERQDRARKILGKHGFRRLSRSLPVLAGGQQGDAEQDFGLGNGADEQVIRCPAMFPDHLSMPLSPRVFLGQSLLSQHLGGNGQKMRIPMDQRRPHQHSRGGDQGIPVG